MTGKREKKALAIFFFLMLFGALCILGYIIVGHNWNYTASDLDDSFGDMDRYTVIVYDGTIEATEATEAQKATLQERIANKVSQWFNLDTDNAASEEEIEEASEVSSLGEQIAASANDASSVANAYREKGANVFVLNLSDPTYYDSGYLVQTDNVRMAILGVHSMLSVSAIQKSVDHLRSLGVDWMMIVTDDVSRVAGVTGVDMVVRADASQPDTLDYEAQGRYITFAPEVGSVAVTTIKGSIVTTKVY